ncbi:retrotransposon nucleocapsid protein [Drepanopeziza brunnea f. sp. 'multigermtubi' MB_m1]|uniref:Retrotransposon nucleocapsid protein n=1 Tax=Marssonina brunnea f. sp. multigermtubi (strain MB_m1) TaxID=1072389 RepID=K1WU61_MARBU|nr:retrotransposon nucleocapsid protein [Drepanopeziza brunnea f. sp. 'multigermtubi' MB_m1]EKD12118.1 retrotransposon nucleocapsid protein [Drepanopeziza brunnea f. sp. 'multigermtubi' MB_m1]
MYLCGASLKDIRKALALKARIDPAIVVPLQYHDYLNAFDQDEANKLVPYKDCDHAIELKPSAILPYSPLYNISQDELLVLRKFFKENLDKGFIRATFNTRYGLFESFVMLFGLSNALATFQARINDILRPFFNIFYSAYIDDILVYSDTLKKHRLYVKAVLRAV